MIDRALTDNEVALARSVFGHAIDYERVRIRNRKWVFFQPKQVVMAPRGNIHFHPRGTSYCDDFCAAHLDAQGLFIHEMTHVWQSQTKGRWYLPLWRSFSRRYDYALRPGWKLEQYGIEQQAEIVRHAFLLSRGINVACAPQLESYRALLQFDGLI